MNQPSYNAGSLAKNLSEPIRQSEVESQRNQLAEAAQQNGKLVQELAGRISAIVPQRPATENPVSSPEPLLQTTLGQQLRETRGTVEATNDVLRRLISEIEL